MSDPRLDSAHLGQTRCDRYRAARGRLLEARGPLTQDAEEGDARDPDALPENSGAVFVLSSLDDGRRYRLHVGLNAVGRLLENDIVVDGRRVSRRHCVLLVHATGGCEIHDTESRNGTFVNRQKVARAWLVPGDILLLGGRQFLLAVEGDC
jgi:pSer/pThr/pTyr-binding forkhead associated (FHA) protein